MYYVKNVSIAAIAREFKVARSTISRVVKYETWQREDESLITPEILKYADERPISEATRARPKITDEERETIYHLHHQNGWKPKEIAAFLEVSVRSVYRILK